MYLMSFCIPSYNNSEAVYKLVSSLLENKDAHFQVVVTDNASADDTLNRLSGIRDGKLKVKCNDYNIGAVPNWCRALEYGDLRLWRKNMMKQKLLKHMHNFTFALRDAKQKTSFSDDGMYTRVVKEALEDEDKFNKFRQNYIYKQIVEAPTKSDMSFYIRELNRMWPEWKEHKEVLIENDSVGGPLVYPCGILGIAVAPYTLSKMLELAYLRKYISDVTTATKKLNIAEIGVGYGGFFRLLYHMGAVKHYTMFDLPNVLKLTDKYLSHFEEIDKGAISYYSSPVKEAVKEYDLVISCHAYNELCGELQKQYLVRVLRKAKHGFLIYNNIVGSRNKGRYNSFDIIRAIPNSCIVPSFYPYREEGIIVW